MKKVRSTIGWTMDGHEIRADVRVRIALEQLVELARRMQVEVDIEAPKSNKLFDFSECS